ncbi:DUF3794 domain-containing protein [Clostridium fallax]|uniref:SipL SPOCS domain-containing protein n=1 Tax=Clostridium fallax TaxID=1533 RepID=A0A1M4SIH5_9CLOT|nr:DUF3794 domain-containing protein [Clostridium fallax]SHE32010.1 hypothetical protein SAMN05443638_10142 [Clostridium fallax]SQB07844.1 Uncharacterised protein [Clostridium fallax]
MSCENYPDILPGGCDLVQCSDIEVDVREINDSGHFHHRRDDVYKVEKLIGKAKLERILIDDVTIPEGFLEIKKIKRRVILTQCKIVGKNLLVEGYIVKNITYVSPVDDDLNPCQCQSFRNNWSDIEVKIPFSIATRIKHHHHLKKNKEKDVSYLCDTMEDCCCDEGFMGHSPCESLTKQKVYLNETPHCKLYKYEITELDVNKKPCNECQQEDSVLYSTLVEKIVLKLYIKVFVKDYIKMPPYRPCDKKEK